MADKTILERAVELAREEHPTATGHENWFSEEESSVARATEEGLFASEEDLDALENPPVQIVSS